MKGDPLLRINSLKTPCMLLFSIQVNNFVVATLLAKRVVPNPYIRAVQHEMKTIQGHGCTVYVGIRTCI